DTCCALLRLHHGTVTHKVVDHLEPWRRHARPGLDIKQSDQSTGGRAVACQPRAKQRDIASLRHRMKLTGKIHDTNSPGTFDQGVIAMKVTYVRILCRQNHATMCVGHADAVRAAKGKAMTTCVRGAAQYMNG